MPKLTLENLGSVGILTDIPSWKIPNNAFTAVGNMRMEYSAANGFGKYEELADVPTSNPYHIVPFSTGIDYYWVIQCDDKIYAWDGTAFTDISSLVGYAGFDSSLKWSGINMGQILFSNHPNLYPEYWNGDILGQMTPLPYDASNSWSDVDLKCDILRGFKGYGIALGIHDASNYYPHMFKWSHPAAPGTVPSSWDHTITTNRAGENELADQGGKIIDAVALRDAMAVYKENSVWKIDWVGGNNVWSFKPVTHTIGALSSDCISEVKGGHVVFAQDDIYIFDGANIKSIVDAKIRQLLISYINSDYAYNSFIANHRPRKEIWFCFPDGDNEFASKAIIWNWQDNTFSIRDLDAIRHIQRGTLISPPEAWDDNIGIHWDSWIGPWGSRNYESIRQTLLGVSTAAKLVAYDIPLSSSVADFRSFVERTDLVLDDLQNVNIITELWPVVEGTKPLKIEIGSQMTPKGPVTWEQPFTFNPGTDRKISCRSVGALHAYRISSEYKEPWKLTDLEIVYEPTGVR